MEVGAIVETVSTIVGALLSIVVSVVAARSAAIRSIVHHLSSVCWAKRLRKAGVSEKKIRVMLLNAAEKDLSR